MKLDKSKVADEEARDKVLQSLLAKYEAKLREEHERIAKVNAIIAVERARWERFRHARNRLADRMRRLNAGIHVRKKAAVVNPRRLKNLSILISNRRQHIKHRIIHQITANTAAELHRRWYEIVSPQPPEPQPALTPLP